MSLIVPDEGEVRLLDILVSGLTATLKLFQNDITPDEDTVLADFTEADFSGYLTLEPSFDAAETVSHKGKIVDSSPRNFTHNGGATSNVIYGYYVEDLADGRVLWAERFTTSQTMANLGDSISITLEFTLNSEN